MKVISLSISKEPRTHPEPNYQLELKDIAININSLVNNIVYEKDKYIKPQKVPKKDLSVNWSKMRILLQREKLYYDYKIYTFLR